MRDDVGWQKSEEPGPWAMVTSQSMSGISRYESNEGEKMMRTSTYIRRPESS